MRQLAADLGCSPMTPYRYFKDKGEILAAVRAAAFDRLCEALDQARADSGDDDARSQARAAGRAYAHFALTQPQTYRLMFDPMRPGEGAYPELMRATERARAAIVRHLSGAGSDPGLTSSPSSAMSGHHCWAALHGALMLYFAEKLGADIGVAELIEDILSEGGVYAISA